MVYQFFLICHEIYIFFPFYRLCSNNQLRKWYYVLFKDTLDKNETEWC